VSLLVLKFGGTSVATVDSIKNVARKIKEEVKRGNKIAVVVSAMAGVTNQLVSYCSEIDEVFDEREYDAVVSSGEQVTSGLLALALQKEGLNARSWQGWQIPMLTSAEHSKARIDDIRLDEMKSKVMQGEIAVIAGFQGMSEDGRITTLGRGGSDTSAVAVAAKLNADRCDIYTDVDGVYTTDPRIEPKARKLSKMSYQVMLEMASMGAKVLQVRSVVMAMKFKVPLQVLSTFDDVIGSDLPGTLLVDEDEMMEKELVTGITSSKEECKIVLRGLQDKPGIANKIFEPFAAKSIAVDMIIQNVSMNGTWADLTFTVAKADLPRSLSILENLKHEMGDFAVESSCDVAKISVIGVGVKSHTGVTSSMFKILAEMGVNIQAIISSEIKITVLIPKEYTEKAVKALHDAYNLDYNKKN